MFFFPQKLFNYTSKVDRNPWPDPRPTDYNNVWSHFRDYKHYNLQELCITFKPKYHQLTSNELYCISKKYIQGRFRRLRRLKPSYIFVPEFNKSGILHYHGLVMFLNCQDTEYHIAELKRLLNNKFGNTRGQQVKCLESEAREEEIKNHESVAREEGTKVRESSFAARGYMAYLQKDIGKNKGFIKPFYQLIKKSSPEDALKIRKN